MLHLDVVISAVLLVNSFVHCRFLRALGIMVRVLLTWRDEILSFRLFSKCMLICGAEDISVQLGRITQLAADVKLLLFLMVARTQVIEDQDHPSFTLCNLD